MSTVIENKIFKKLLNSTPWNLQESALGGLGEGVHLPRIENQGSVRPRHSFKVSRRAPPRSFACSDLYANYDRLPRPPGPAAEDACQAQGKAASVRTECRISIRSGWILGDQDEQAKPTGSFPAVPPVRGVTAPPFGCGFGRQVPGAPGECTRATRRRPAGRILLVTSEAGPRLPGRSGSPRPRWPFSVPTGLRLPAPAPGRHGRSHSAACTMPGAGQWAATHPRRLPSRPLVSEEPPWRPAELTKHSGPLQAWQPFPATRGSHGAAGDVSQRAARWDSPVRAPRPPTSTHALGSPPPDVCGAPPACERDTR